MQKNLVFPKFLQVTLSVWVKYLYNFFLGIFLLIFWKLVYNKFHKKWRNFSIIIHVFQDLQQKYTGCVCAPFPAPCRRVLNNEVVLHSPFFAFDDFFHIILSRLIANVKKRRLFTMVSRDISVRYIYHGKEGDGNRLIGIPQFRLNFFAFLIFIIFSGIFCIKQVKQRPLKMFGPALFLPKVL